MNGVEGITISDWLNDTLVADATLQGLLGGPGGIVDRVVEGVAPPGTDYPLITFGVGDEGRVIGAVGPNEVMARFLVTVKAITQGESYTPVLPISSRAWALIHDQVNRVTALGTVMSVQRIAAIQYPERADGIEYRHLGGLYEINVQ